MDPTIETTIPNGVIIAPKPKDFIMGDGNIASPIRVPDGVWTPFVPKGERQSGNGFDTNDCTGFGYTNVIETQFKPIQGQISVEAMQFLSDNGYLDENGVPNFSDRALGSMAGTSSAGNALNVVAETARTKGLIPESKWPSVFTTYADYYKPVPKELLNLGKQFLQYFDLPYEKVLSSQVGEALKSAPLYVALVTCGGWNNPEPPPLAWCNASGSNHCVALLKENNYQIFDSYPISSGSFIKDFASDYVIPYFYKVLLIPKGQLMNQAKVVLGKDGLTQYVCYPVPSEDYLKTKSSLEGFPLPNPVPKAVDAL